MLPTLFHSWCCLTLLTMLNDVLTWRNCAINWRLCWVPNWWLHLTHSLLVSLSLYMPVWKTGRIMGTPAAGWRAVSTEFSLSKSKSSHRIFIKLGEYVGGHNISTKFYNQLIPQAFLNYGPWIVQNCPKLGFPLSKSKSFHLIFIKLVNMFVSIISRPSSITWQIPLGTRELWPLYCPKLGFLLSKSKSFRPVVIKLGEHVGRHNILTKFHNQPNPARHSWIMALELSKIRVYALFVKEFSSSLYLTWWICWWA